MDQRTLLAHVNLCTLIVQEGGKIPIPYWFI